MDSFSLPVDISSLLVEREEDSESQCSQNSDGAVVGDSAAFDKNSSDIDKQQENFSQSKMDAAAMQAMITALGDQLTKSLVDQTKKNLEQMDAALSAQEQRASAIIDAALSAQEQRISAAMDEQAKQSAKEMDAAL
ncbi:MAG: hypothetical protein GY820_34630, partial [Gammaproteobacteria bacterium]|nr:hypothetical protein [Gammaproteobacteria bacterium]